MMNIKKKSMDFALPSIEGGAGVGSPFNWSLLLKTLVAVLTALAGALGLSACVRW